MGVAEVVAHLGGIKFNKDKEYRKMFFLGWVGIGFVERVI